MLSETTAKRYWAPPCRGPWATVPLHGGARVMIRPAIIEAVKAMDAVFRRYDYRAYANQTGAQNCRVVKGTRSMSTHAYGIAIDVNWQCVTGDTMITTWDGPKPIGELVDQKVKLLSLFPYEGGASR